MTYNTTWTGAATNGLKRIDRQYQSRLIEAVVSLANDPRPHGAKKLEPKSMGLYSLRVGIHLRVLYSIDDPSRTVLILKVGNRENFY